MSKKCAERLTDLEVQVMKVLWDSERAMTNSEIAEKLKEETNLSVASVAQLVKRLLQKDVLEVDEHVPVANVYARTFRPKLTREEFIAGELLHIQKATSSDKKKGLKGIFAALFMAEEENGVNRQELEAIEHFIQKKKEEMKDGE